MSPETAIAIVKKYAALHGVRKTARIFDIDPSTVSRILNNKGSISGLRIAAKVAAAGTFTCPELKVLILPELCHELREKIKRRGFEGLIPEHRKLYWKCPNCKTGDELCLAK